MISNNLQCLYGRVPKTASTSILYTLGRHKFKKVTWVDNSHMFDLHHIPLPFLKQCCPLKYEKYFKFGFVRNPWERMFSQYHYSVKWLKQRKRASQWKDFEDFIFSLEDPSKSSYSKTRWTQAYFVEGADFIGRFENLKEDYHAMKEIHPPFKKARKWLSRRNTGRKPKGSYLSAYSDAAKKEVARYYEEDIDLFKYTFEK